MEKLIRSIVKQIKEKVEETPEIAIILGSGLSGIVDCLEQKKVVMYDELEGMLKTKVEGHKNQFVFGKLHGKNIVAMQGRFHLYDGFTAKEVCMPIYLFKELGVKTLIITNASGGIADNLNAGDIMVVEDHINNTHQNAMIGGYAIDYGKQFVDMTEPYDVEYRNIIKKCADDLSMKIKKGTYLQTVGPFYETKAEVRMMKVLGADAVGMSSAIEAEAANHCGLRVLALSTISNKACGLSDNKLDHKEVLEMGKITGEKLVKLISEFVKNVQ